MPLYIHNFLKISFEIQVDDGKGSSTEKPASGEIDDNGEESDDHASEMSKIPSTSSSNSKQGQVAM